MDERWADLASLELQMAWGADEALQETPVNRLDAPPPPTAVPDTPRLAADVRPAAAIPRSPSGLAAAPALAIQAASCAAAAMDLAALHRAIDAFDACPLRGTATRTVAPSGNPAGGLVFVADAPGRDDDVSGQAFSGAVGALMDRVLGAAGLGRDRALLTHLVPWRPPGGREPNAGEVAASLPFLVRRLQLCGARRVVTLGAAPARALTGATHARPGRGKWGSASAVGLDGIAVLGMAAPETWLKSAASREATWLTLLEVRRAIDADGAGPD